LSQRNSMLRGVFGMLILGPAIQSFNGKNKGPIESAFLLISTVVGLAGLGTLEVWTFLRDKRQPRVDQALADDSSLAAKEPASKPEWMGTSEGRKRRVVTTLVLTLALIATGIVLVNLLHLAGE
jgi:hypothetical protein